MYGRPQKIPKVSNVLYGSGDQMSLINRMLNDLDARRAVDHDARLTHRDIRPLPARRPSIAPWIIAILSVALLSVLATGWWLTQRNEPPLPTNPGLPPLELSAEPLIPSLNSSPSDINAPTRVDRPIASGRALALDLKLSSRLSVSSQPPPQAVAERSTSIVPPTLSEVPSGIEKQDVQTSPEEKAERLYRAALAFLAQGRTEDGLTTLRAVLREEAKHVAARQLLLKHYIDRRSYDDALPLLQEGLTLWPEQTPWALLLSRLQADRGDNAGALSTLEKSAGYAINSAEYHAAMGAILQRLDRHAEAGKHYEQSTRIDSANGRWWLGLGLANELQGKPIEAHNAFQRAANAHNLSAELQAFVEQKLSTLAPRH